MGLTFAALLPPCAVDPPPLEVLVQQVINGVVLGSLIGLIAIGYTLVYGIIQLINFAHGEVVMIGAMVAFTIINALAPSGMPPLAVVLIGTGAAIPVCVLVGYSMERLAYRPLRRAPRLAPLITAIGVSIALQEGIRLFYPNGTRAQNFHDLRKTSGGLFDGNDVFTVARQTQSCGCGNV